MKGIFKLMVATSEAREALNRYVAETKEPDAAKVTELRGAVDKAEAEFRAEVAKLDEKPAEDRKGHVSERIELRNYMHAALRGSKLTGAEAECNKEFRLEDSQVPWEALAPLPHERPAEERADAATTLPSSTSDDNVIAHQRQELLRRVFRMSRTSFLRMRMPMVGMGEPVYPVMTDGVGYGQDAATAAADRTASAHAPGGEVEAQAATFVGKMVAPKRISARYLFRIEDAARFPVEEVLRSDLRMVMTQLLDEQVFNGDDTGGQFNGLLRDAAAGPLGANKSATEVVTTAIFLKAIYDYVDGFAAGNVSDVRVLMGQALFAKLGTLFLSDSGQHFFALLRRLMVPAATWAGVPAPATENSEMNVQQTIMTRRGSDCVIPVWQGVTLIRDPYSGAASGEVAITAHMLANMELLRSAHWQKAAFKTE